MAFMMHENRKTAARADADRKSWNDGADVEGIIFGLLIFVGVCFFMGCLV